jgi:DNA helicase-2/ATP-dependent DNA helicase PcrA
MTAHTAKGLEYPIVFVVRLNQGVFPNNRAMEENGFKAMEEERRLAYVAMTRAKERLYLTCCQGFSYVTKNNLNISQFFAESGNAIKQNNYFNDYSGPRRNNNLYQDKYKFEDFKNGKGFDFNDEPIRQDFSQVVNDVTGWDVGDIVIHKKLGRGVVIAVEEDDIIKVNFDEHGVKTILGNHPSVSKGSK